jgi:hypothetical protein
VGRIGGKIFVNQFQKKIFLNPFPFPFPLGPTALARSFRGRGIHRPRPGGAPRQRLSGTRAAGTRSSPVVRTNLSLRLAIRALYFPSNRQLHRSSLTGLQSAHVSPFCTEFHPARLLVIWPVPCCFFGASIMRFAA